MEQLDTATFTGAHPTNREFVEQLRVWGFTSRRADGVHLAFRGPHGGTVRVLRSLLGRPDPDVVAKAARLARVELTQFWSGPSHHETDLVDDDPLPDGAHEAEEHWAEEHQAEEHRAEEPQTHAAEGVPTGEGSATVSAVMSSGSAASRRAPADRDRNTSLVLAAHTSTDRPLGFDQVVRLCQGRITRPQAQAASAALCRDGHLERIRNGVYQWSGGRRAAPLPPSQVAPAYDGTVRSAWPTAGPARPSAASTVPAVEATTAALFEQLFPAGVQMTAELLTDFEQWARLTAKLAASARAA